MKKLFLLLLLCAFGITLFAQDAIILTNKKEIYCHIVEVNTTEVKYRKDTLNPVIYAVDITLVKEVRFADGTTQKIEGGNTFDNEVYYNTNRKKAIKFEMFAPLSGHSTFLFEKSIKPGRSYELGLGIIGLGKQYDNPANGLFIKAGYKFLRTPDFYLKNMRYAHILKGSYARPDLTFGVYNVRDNYMGFNDIKRTVTYGAITINLGKQIIFDDAFLLDYYVGVGYGFAVSKTKIGPVSIEDGRTTTGRGVAVGSDSPIAFTAGFRIGFLTH